MKTVSPTEYHSNPAPYTLIDVRTPDEFREAHILGAKLHTLDDLNPEQVKACLDGKPALVTCLSGGRAKRAAQKLADAGVDCALLEDALHGWERAGLPVVRSTPKGLPLIRQTLLTVGLINLTAVILTLTLNPKWIYLLGFTACGLIVAGATGFCGMAFILARMPWNRSR